MKKEFEEFIDLVEKSLDRCPWLKTKSVEDYKEEIVSEAKEVSEAVEKKDYENLKEELGDLFWDVTMLAAIAENKGLFRKEEIIKSVNEKMKRRRPFIVGEKREISREEARKLWVEAKEKEKVGKMI